jgi:type II secretory pathway component PulK
MSRNNSAFTGSRLKARHARSGLMLVVVLVVVALLSLLAASYTFLVSSNLHEAIANHERFQARMAAEAGIQKAILVLRETKNDPAIWYDNAALFGGQIVYQMPRNQKETEAAGTEEAAAVDPDIPTWRFNIVAPNHDAPGIVRYGVTDECARLNLNMATQEQLLRLFAVAIPQDMQSPVDLPVLIDSLMDWRSSGGAPRPNGAKDEYYSGLNPPYRCKQAPFSTVEELLLVRGFSAWILFGEDYNRNGLLDPNEDDGDSSFPPDDGDGALFAGIAPFLTLWSQEMNVSKDGRQKINLNEQDVQKLQDQLTEEFNPAIVSYVAQVRGGGMQFNSIMNLLPAPTPEEQARDNPPPEEDPTTSQPETSQPTSAPTGQKQRRGGPLSSDQGRLQDGSQNPPATSQPVYSDLTPTPPPGTLEDLPQILDRLTVQPTPLLNGRINIVTAPREVLATLTALRDEEIAAITAARVQLPPEERSTAAWLLRQNVLGMTRFRQILDKITTKSTVFRLESVGYADHVGVVERLAVILEMRGPMAQILYSRNLTSLGAAYNFRINEQRGPVDKRE